VNASAASLPHHISTTRVAEVSIRITAYVCYGYGCVKSIPVAANFSMHQPMTPIWRSTKNLSRITSAFLTHYKPARSSCAERKCSARIRAITVAAAWQTNGSICTLRVCMNSVTPYRRRAQS
jgi:hypothetical protein